MYKIKNDKYKSARGGHSRILDVSCAKCGTHVTYYQKDGPGALMRMYLDRMIDNASQTDDLVCTGCMQILAKKYIFEKEQRPAYRMFVGAFTKKIVKKDSIAP